MFENTQFNCKIEDLPSVIIKTKKEFFARKEIKRNNLFARDMNKIICQKIIDNIPTNSIVHIKTKTGEKICVRDNGKTSTATIELKLENDYILVLSKNISERKTTESRSFIVYEAVSQIEAVSHWQNVSEHQEG